MTKQYNDFVKDDEHPLSWKITASSYPIDTPYLRLRKDSIDLPSGAHVPDYYVRESRGFSVIFARTPEGRIVMVRQYKHGIGAFVRELPAGAIDAGESPLDCAIRELSEETGYTGTNARLVASFIADPTNSTSLLHLCALDDAVRTGDQLLDPTESIDVELATPHEALALIRTGGITPIAHVACLYYMLDQIGMLHGAGGEV